MKNCFNSLFIVLLLLITGCSKDSSEETTSIPSYTLTVNQSEGGTVNSSGGSYQKGTQVSLSATPNQGYIFTGWSNGSTSNPLNITINSNIEISPRFEQAIVSRLELSLAQTSVMMGQETNYTYMAYDQNDGPLPDAVPSISISDSLFARIENQRIITEYDGLLTIYGRINEVVDSIQLEIQPDYNNWKTYFRPIENGMPDLSDVCNNGGNCANTNSVKIDLNNDGRQDLLLHFFKDRYPLNLPYDGPTYNRLVALIANENNQLEDKTLEIFGSDLVDLAGGASRNHKVFDLNQDGYDDVVFALNREDGRSYDQINQTWFTLPVAIISNGDGTYRKEVYGDEGYFHSVTVYKNSQGEVEIILGNDEEFTLQNRKLYSYRFSNNTFSPFTTLVQGRDGGSISSFNNSSGEIQFLVASKDGGRGLDFYSNSGNGLVKYKQFDWEFDFDITYTDWMGDTNTKPVKNYLGYTFVGIGGFWDSTFLKLTPSGDVISVIHYAGEFYDGEVNEGDILTDDQTPLISKVFAFDDSMSVEELDIFPNNGIHETNVNFIEAIDVNNDGYEDLVKYPYRYEGKPIVYLNNTQGSFSELTNNNVFPSYIDFVDTSQFIDINGDGVLDIIFRQSGTNNNYVQPLLFLGRKPLPNQ